MFSSIFLRGMLWLRLLVLLPALAACNLIASGEGQTQNTISGPPVVNLASPLPDVLDVSVPASGGTDAGTFKVEVEPDVEVHVVWPWPAAWPVTSE